ncbi:MAG: SprB repeat-containing protein [Saprospiraceae bacterium]
MGNPDWTLIPGAEDSGYNPGVLTENTYFVRVSKRQDCTDYVGVSNMVSILLAESPVLDTFYIDTPSCFQGNDGSITVVISGGTAPYTYSWDNGAGMDSIASGLEAGTYTVTILDANFCGLVSEFTVEDGEALETTTSWWAEPCNYATGGTATIEIINGEAPLPLPGQIRINLPEIHFLVCLVELIM